MTATVLSSVKAVFISGRRRPSQPDPRTARSDIWNFPWSTSGLRVLKIFWSASALVLIVQPSEAFSEISLVLVRSDPRTGPDLLVRADQLFGPWIPGLILEDIDLFECKYSICPPCKTQLYRNTAVVRGYSDDFTDLSHHRDNGPRHFPPRTYSVLFCFDVAEHFSSF